MLKNIEVIKKDFINNFESDFKKVLDDVKNEERLGVHSFHRYYGKLIPAIPRAAIRQFTQEGDIVFDPFVGAGRITNMPSAEERGTATYEPIERLQKYVGRLIVDVYKGNTQGRYNFWLRKFINECKVVEILPELYGGESFPGFKNLRLSYEQLYRGIYINRAWKAVLKTQKGIYVIVDKAPESEYSGLGRIYVGKASSDNGMLYDRWKNYADSLTGGNKELELVKKQKGEDYIKKYFQWSLLENFDESVEDTIILEREKYWKLVLNSKNQGLNDNY